MRDLDPAAVEAAGQGHHGQSALHWREQALIAQAERDEARASNADLVRDRNDWRARAEKAENKIKELEDQLKGAR